MFPYTPWDGFLIAFLPCRCLCRARAWSRIPTRSLRVSRTRCGLAKRGRRPHRHATPTYSESTPQASSETWRHIEFVRIPAPAAGSAWTERPWSFLWHAHSRGALIYFMSDLPSRFLQIIDAFPFPLSHPHIFMDSAPAFVACCSSETCSPFVTSSSSPIVILHAWFIWYKLYSDYVMSVVYYGIQCFSKVGVRVDFYNIVDLLRQPVRWLCRMGFGGSCARARLRLAVRERRSSKRRS